ncbi:hypothetical protein HHI36_009937 [Cryptolaemus montrouzieri]|uniref:Uncharacterized protein n=1 Tax=Cryptolaemus montrouzieri TaxID=559131 RepID=A0ABD2MHC9_9CUCU
MLLLTFWAILAALCIQKGITASYRIDISSYNPLDDKTHTFHLFVNHFEQNSTELIVTSNATNTSGFYILQAHSFEYNVTLTGYGEVANNVTGRNVGLLQFFKNPLVNSFSLEKMTDKNLTVLIAVTIYEDKTPIPGGCAKVDSITGMKINPLIRVIDGEEIINIRAEAPSVEGLTCDMNDTETRVDIYHKYLSSQNFNPLIYYEGIRSMLSVEDIKKNGKFVSSSHSLLTLKKSFSSYIGVGEVFVILITQNGKTSAYVPAVSYGQDIEILIMKDKAGNASITQRILEMPRRG